MSKTILIGRHAAVLDDEAVSLQKLDARGVEFPADDHGAVQGLLDYVRDVLVDQSFRDQAAAAHALRALVEYWMGTVYGGDLDFVDPAIEDKCRLAFAKAYPLGVTIVG